MLELKHIQKSFDGSPVLKDISIQVEDGEIVSILGPSGCGKTTLLNLILGITQADGGSIVYNGEDLTHAAMEKRGFNIVFQDYALFPNLNVYQNVTNGLKNKPDISTKEEVEELIALQNELSAESNQRCIGREYEVLIEGVSKRSREQLFGRTEQNKVVVFDRGNCHIGQYARVVVTEASSATLKGHLVENAEA